MRSLFLGVDRSHILTAFNVSGVKQFLTEVSNGHVSDSYRETFHETEN